ncbi:zinc-binding alcohol dehydrogenase family protein [Terriglobus saanensis]|uniref:Alcohol dehydrogenase zinc-binding domain protein n=1 Tax=Terriglobus saanensis (strain ATCC BAA-1853 / DSM 23119 / SP1PR4) TaxID=401053 RepID=E8V1U2_TERSS|nr:zinc-binding alcohol dehydrogenase family protein [Terriglobus saanensis]ADV83430.1 Alcohol dehydrogenase zinc-binding domain protein [Terriglobus saanensis SP1PR4]
MKAVSLTGPGQVAITEITEPVSKQGEVLLRVEMVGLCGTDLNSFRGKNPLITYPRVIGHEIAATVLEGSVSIPAGTRVTVSPYTHCGHCAACSHGRVNACQFNQTFGVQRDGAMTELLSVSADKLYPSSLSFKELCLVEPLTVGVHAAARARVDSKDIVAVYGCGGVGLGAIAGAAFRGATTIAIDLDDEKLETARAAGAVHLIHSSRDNVHERLQEISGGFGPDVVIEAIGLPDTFRAAVEEVGFTGRIVYIGYAKELVSYETRLFVQKELDIMGSRNALPQDFREVMAILEAGRFPVDRAVSTIVPLTEAPAMLAKWSENPASFTKIMVSL